MKQDRTTVIVSKEHAEKLSKLAGHFKRSKTMQLEWMIDIEWMTLFEKDLFHEEEELTVSK